MLSPKTLWTKKVLTDEQKAAKAEVQTWRKEIAKERKLEAFYREMEEAKKGLDQKIDAYHNRYRRRISTRNQNRIDVAAQLKNILAEKTTSRTVYEQYQASKKSDDTIQKYSAADHKYGKPDLWKDAVYIT